MNTIKLTGCRPEPLLAYLKALGIFRLVAEQADKTARAAWHEDVFVLHTALSEAELLTFFAERYTPTPIVAPWNGEDFFLIEELTKNYQPVKKPTGAAVFVAIVKSKTTRLSSFRQAISQVLDVMNAISIKREKPKEKGKSATLKIAGKDIGTKDVKTLLVNSLRSQLQDEIVAWMDATLILESRTGFSPLLGMGGTDGNLDFSLNFAQRLLDIGFADKELSPKSEEWLTNALYGLPTKGLLNSAIGQFDPGRAGGLNAGQGMFGDARVNPWEYVLMLEGALLMAGSATRRLNANSGSKSSFPFTISESAVGNGSLNTGDKSHGEVWLPLWNNPARLSELRQIFAEGRAQLGKRQAHNAVDFARAIAGIGVDRGLTGFTRFGFLERFGRLYLATPLGRFETHTSATHANLLDDLETNNWLDKFRWACNKDNVPGRFLTALRRLDESIFEYCRFGGAARFGEIVRALGNCEREISFNRDKAGTIGKDGSSKPVPLLSPDWLLAAQEDSPEFRLALALAAMRETGAVGALRCNLEVVTRAKWGWDWADASDRYAAVWSATTLPRNLQAVLERRMMDATRAGLEGLPLESHFSASAEDVAAFLNGQTDDRRLEEWLWGLMLIDLAKASYKDLAPMTAPAMPQPLPRAYALLKLLFTPKYHALKTEGGQPIKPEPTILSHLRAPRLRDACQLAARRLRASGHVPLPGPASGGRTRIPDYSAPKPMLDRMAAALLIPVSQPEQLQALVLRPSSDSQGDF